MMRTKTIGIFLVIISMLLAYLVFSYNQIVIERNKLLHASCPLPPEVCPYKQKILTESYFGFSLSIIVLLIGVYLIFSQQKLEKLTLKEKTKLTKNVKSLDNEEKKIYQLLEDSDGTMFQSDLITKTGFSKVKISRILDRLEMKGVAERRRRGMANIVIIKTLQ